jgi:predicted ester cyclase
MDSKATVQAVMDSIQKGDFNKAKSFLSNDFQFSGPVPEPINAEAWMGMSLSLKKAFPNLEYHFHVESMDGDTASISAQLKGTQTGEFDLTGMHMGTIPATNKAFSAAKEYGKATVKGDKVTSWANTPIEGAGLMAILGQLGIKPPSM